MPEVAHQIDVDVSGWVGSSRRDPVEWHRRQAAEVALNALADLLPEYEFRLKGGFLMGLVHGSPRMTTDIDLSANFPPRPGICSMINAALDAALRSSAARLGYVDLVVQVHSAKERPKGQFDRSRHPALKIKIVHFRRQLAHPRKPPARQYLDIDVSFNETIFVADVLRISGERSLLAYGLAELIAEKYRALLQQIPRRRRRRQDVYDLHYLLTENRIDDTLKREIFVMMLAKCHARGIDPEQDSLDEPELRRRSEEAWETLRVELGELPRFTTCYDLVKHFYRDLPWS